MSESDFRGSDDSQSKWLKSHPGVLHQKFPTQKLKRKKERKIERKKNQKDRKTLKKKIQKGKI